MLSRDISAALPLASVTNVTRVLGGDINEAFCLASGGRKYFLKVQRKASAAFFSKEITGLRLMGQTVRTPGVIASGSAGEDAFLLMDWIDSGPRDEAKLAAALVSLHKQTSETFGFSESNYLGTLPQRNTPSRSWSLFYMNQRLLPQAALAKKQGRWNAEREKHFLAVIKKIKEMKQSLCPAPSLLHGDLWSGNVMFDAGSEPVFIDPAVYYGSREVDIAMARLFGGFSSVFYETYEQLFPLESGFEQRIPLYQLYYLLAHLNLFGESYGSSVDRALKQAL